MTQFVECDSCAGTGKCPMEFLSGYPSEKQEGRCPDCNGEGSVEMPEETHIKPKLPERVRDW